MFCDQLSWVSTYFELFSMYDTEQSASCKSAISTSLDFFKREHRQQGVLVVGFQTRLSTRRKEGSCIGSRDTAAGRHAAV